ncbi:MAG: Fe-S oxidoreductase, partial [Proteobacteria bacterium]
IASSINLYFTDRKRAKGALKNPGDLEKLMEEQEEFSIGLGTIKDYSWKQLLDLDACTSCGRCQDVCPAYLSGKPLSPKWIILDTRNHLLSLQAKGTLNESGANSISAKMDQALLGGGYLASSGLRSDGSYTNGGRFRAENELVQSAALKIGESSEQRILGEVIAGEAFWSCTTCMACVEACPVGINHVDQIVGNRQNAALMHGEVPGEAQATLKKLEKQANPYGDPKDRCLWLAGLDLKILKPGDSVDYLYWVGCVSAYDQRKQKIAKALVRLMHAADLSFGVLGEMEGCSGDPARRLGEENLYQVMAKANIETLRSIKFKVLVANCPHCFNTIRNEYPQFGRISETEEVKIMHHSQLLRELLAQGKLKLKDVGEDLKVTMHDPCYLGRYNDEYEAPRQSLSKVKGLQIVEMERSREKAMCCGAGGGHYWMDLKIGERVNVLRTQQAQETGAGQIATACPFCMQMLEDGVNLAGLDGKMTVRDVAEVLADRI